MYFEQNFNKIDIIDVILCEMRIEFYLSLWSIVSNIHRFHHSNSIKHDDI